MIADAMLQGLFIPGNVQSRRCDGGDLNLAPEGRRTPTVSIMADLYPRSRHYSATCRLCVGTGTIDAILASTIHAIGCLIQQPQGVFSNR